MPTEKLPRAVSEADQEFFARHRKLSPRYPDAASQLLRLQMRRETLAARILLGFGVLFAGSAFASFFTEAIKSPWGLTGASLACLAGFIITCFVAGSRAHDRAGGRSGNPL